MGAAAKGRRLDNVRSGGIALCAITLVLTASGCGGGGTSCPGNGRTQPVQRPVPRGTRYLTDVTITSTTCTDRVEFSFEHGVPGYRIAYTGAALAQSEDASGRHIPVAGRAFLVVHLADAATARSSSSGISRTYSGPRRLPAPNAKYVREVVKTGEFEAVVTWAIGLDERRPFTVSRSRSSLAVDIG